MAIGKKIAGGFAWIGLAVILGVPAADVATGQLSNSDTASATQVSVAALETPVPRKSAPAQANPTTLAQATAPAGNLTTPAKPVPRVAAPATTLVLPGTTPRAPSTPSVTGSATTPPSATRNPVVAQPTPRIVQPQPGTSSATVTRTPEKAAPMPRPLSERPIAVARNEEIYIPPEVALPQRRAPQPRFPVPPSEYLPPLGFEEPAPSREFIRPSAQASRWADEYEYGYQDDGYGYAQPQVVYPDPYDDGYGYDDGGDILIGPVDGGGFFDELFR